MKRPVVALVVGLFFVTFATGPSTQKGGGCSSSPAKKPEEAPVAPPTTTTPRNTVRRDPPPLMAPGDMPPTVKPMSLKDESGVTFEFESDGQHVKAVNADGSIRWHKNPVADAGIKGWTNGGKTLWPIIHYAGPPLEWMLKVMKERGKSGEYISVSFTTKEFGLLNKQTGEYTSMGSD